jgi:hypothetical protein
MKTACLPILISLLSSCVDDELQTSELDQDLYAQSTTQLFDKFKQLEVQYPKPPAYSTVNVGTLDSYSGEFTGLKTWTEIRYEEGDLKPRTIVHAPSATIDGVNAKLVFNCSNRPKFNRGPFYAVINGTTYNAAAGALSLTVDVGLTKTATWSVHCDNASYSDKLPIYRPQANAAGAFEITAVPIGLLYEPPMNVANTNYAAYTTGTQRSSIVSIGSSTATSTTGAPMFDAVTDLSNKLDVLKSIAPGASTLAGLLGDAKTLLGSSSTTITNASTVASDHTVESTVSGTTSIQTAAHTGPGHGDIVSYLRRARFVWTMVRGEVAVTLIDFEIVYDRTIDELLADYNWLANQPAGTIAQHTGLDRNALSGLLSLDPFAGGAWNSTRFEYVTSRSLAAGQVLNSDICHVYKETDKQTQTKTKTTVKKTEEGWLGIVGLGPSDGSSSTTLTESSSRSVTTGSSVCAKFSLSRALNDPPYGVDIYFDRQFGTFVFNRI